MGVVYPDNIMAGNIKTKTRSIDCCWVLENAEIKSPIKEIENKNMHKEKMYKNIDPKKGILNIKIEIKRIITPFKTPKNKGIKIFPAMISSIFKGTIRSSSNVPCSFSLARDNAESKITVVMGKMPIRLEIINHL